MPISGRVTNEGLLKSIKTAYEDGWVIKPKAFACAQTAGAIEVARTINEMEPVFYTGLISARVVQGPNTIEFICTIPPGQTSAVTEIKELYLLAEDNDGVDFLLAFGQPSNQLLYEPEGSLRMRLLLTIANVDIGSIYEFKYTQATEISDHNLDPNAHPEIQAMIESLRSDLTSLQVQTGNTGWTPKFISADYVAKPQEYLYVDCSAGPVNVTLPPTLGTEQFSRVAVNDVSYNSSTNNITVARGNSQTIENVEEDLIIDVDGASVIFGLHNSNWKANATASVRSVRDI